jgi:hypothetical protein
MTYSAKYFSFTYVLNILFYICLKYVRFEVFTAVTTKIAVFLDVTPCGSCTDRRFGGTYRLHDYDDEKLQARNKVSSNQQRKHAANK